MMSTESANSFTLIGEASDGGSMENLSRRLKAISVSNVFFILLFHHIPAFFSKQKRLRNILILFSSDMLFCLSPIVFLHPGDQ